MRTQCKEWSGCRNKAGYGKLTVKGRRLYAHRYAMAYYLGIPIEALDGIKVCHSCDNPPCCNPEHLFLGDQKTNMQDMIAKGRRPQLRTGELCGNSKLTEPQVKTLRRLYASGLYTQRALADSFYISEAQASRILTGKHWTLI